ncbi:MAG: hypothetical protein KGL16_14545 [Acidobacteriota bacterium]|nr:hypothetical protein [Acidobacteriota bacterium]
MTLEAPAAKSTAGATAPPLEAPGDATYGWEMFVAFVAAVVGISIVVAVLALVGSWWMLGVAVAVHLGVTATMMRLVYGAFGSEEHAYPDMHTAEAASRAAISANAGSTRPARVAVEF